MDQDRTVHLIEDDEAERRVLESEFRTAHLCVTPYASAHHFFAAAAHLAGGCILAEIRLSETDGPRLLAKLHQLGCRLPVLFLAHPSEFVAAIAALKVGAVDILPKPIDMKKLLRAVRSALLRGTLAKIAAGSCDAARRIASLTPRCRDVLENVVAGYPNKIIAYNLGISPRTVESHKAQMMQRLGVRHTSEAIRIALEAELACAAVPAAA